MEPMTNAAYVDNGGMQCPYCRGVNIRGRSPEVLDAHVIIVEVGCLDCEKQWNEEFNLVGWSEIEYGRLLTSRTWCAKLIADLEDLHIRLVVAAAQPYRK